MSLVVIKQRAENDPGFQLREKLVLQVDSSDQRLHRKLIIMQIRVKKKQDQCIFLERNTRSKGLCLAIGASTSYVACQESDILA